MKLILPLETNARKKKLVPTTTTSFFKAARLFQRSLRDWGGVSPFCLNYINENKVNTGFEIFFYYLFRLPFTTFIIVITMHRHRLFFSFIHF